jgi:hypothetical protein
MRRTIVSTAAGILFVVSSGYAQLRAYLPDQGDAAASVLATREREAFLFIIRDWTVWIVDHTGAFRVRQRLEYPGTLTRCGRAVLGRLRDLTRERLQRLLGAYLSAEQLDALEIRRQLLVKHFDDRIARMGEAAVLYDLPIR